MKRKRYQASRAIIERLDKGPATPKQLSDELLISPSTVMHNLRKFLPGLGLITNLPDGKYCTRWREPEEFRVKSSYDTMRKKLLRPPTPHEISAMINKRSDESKELLFKYIPAYQEPSEDEIKSSARALFKTIILEKLSLPSRQDWFKKGIASVILEGLDNQILEEILEAKSENREDARSYLNEFPGMTPNIEFVEKDVQAKYTIELSNEANRALGSFGSRHMVTEIRIPLKLDREMFLRYKVLIEENRSYALRKILEMSNDYAPTPEALEDLLELLRGPGNREDILIAIKGFCRNGLELDQISQALRSVISEAIRDMAFETNGERKHVSAEDYMEREHAFSIIELLGPGDQLSIERAKEFVFIVLEAGYESGGYLMRVSKWLAKDVALRAALKDKAEEILLKAEKEGQEKIVIGCNNFIKAL